MASVTNRVFVVCGVFNELKHTQKMIECLKRQSWKTLKIIIVDDGSTDGTSQWLQSSHPDVQVLSGNGSLWWTGAIAKGVDFALKTSQPGDFILTMNNDCFFNDDYISTIVDVSIARGRAVVGSIAIDQQDHNRVVDSGVRIDWRYGNIEAFETGTVAEMGSRELNDKVDTLSTRGTLFPVEVFAKVGNFDAKHLPHYLSDYEFGCRLKSAGVPILVSFRAKVFNDGNRTGFREAAEATRLSLRKVYDLMFARKSKSNVVDHWWFVTLCCPREYKITNYLRLARRTLRIASFALPMRTFIKRVKDFFFPRPAI